MGYMGNKIICMAYSNIVIMNLIRNTLFINVLKWYKRQVA